jgi:PilZ domain-containing protein
MPSFIGHLIQASSMVPCTDTDNRRHARRFRAQHPAKIVFGPESMISCTVKDISTGGARIAVMPHMPLPQNFELFIAAHDLQVRRARVCWRNGDSAGVAFDVDQAGEDTVQPFLIADHQSHVRLVANREAPARDEAAKVAVEVERYGWGRRGSLLRNSA